MTEQPLREAGVDEEDIRAILSHGYEICSDVKPETEMEKSLFTVDELTGIVQACARMRLHGITDLEIKSFMKKFKDKRFAAKCDRTTIMKGCEMLGMDVKEGAEIVIEGMTVLNRKVLPPGQPGKHRDADFIIPLIKLADK